MAARETSAFPMPTKDLGETVRGSIPPRSVLNILDAHSDILSFNLRSLLSVSTEHNNT